MAIFWGCALKTTMLLKEFTTMVYRFVSQSKTLLEIALHLIYRFFKIFTSNGFHALLQTMFVDELTYMTIFSLNYHIRQIRIVF